MRAVPMNQKGSGAVTRQTLRYYWSVTRKHWPWALGDLISSLAFTFFLSYLNPYLIGLIVDRVSEGPTQPDQLWTAFGPVVAALVLSNVLGQVGSKLQDYFCAKLEIRASYDLTNLAFDTLSNQSMTFYNNRFGGSLVSQVQRFVGGYSTLCDCVTYSVIAIASSACFTIVMLAGLVPVYVCVLLVLMAVYVLVVYRLYSRILPANAVAAAANNRLSGQLSDSITNILAVKTSGREDYERGRFTQASQEVADADGRRMRANIRCGAATSSIIVVIMACCTVFLAGGNTWFGVAPGTLVMMFTYTNSLTMQFNRLSSMFQTLNRALGDAYDMTQALGEPLLVADEPDAKGLTVTRGAIDFAGVGFHYPDAPDDDKVFDGFDLSIPAGQRVGLVGRSGSGKTTLTTLLLRLADLQEGTIAIDGQDVRGVRQASVRRQIAYVPQEPLLFHRSIYDNIAYGRPEAAPEEVLRAAEKANALEFIEKLPEGFDTMVGERGVKLSGGQRQRIAIARAILMDAPILVLDEATSALDSESERLIQEALATLMTGRTSIVVAHRLSTVASLDRIVVLQDGRIVEDGPHAELVAAGGPYEQLWDRQTGAFLEG
ncbi:ABC transporter ATP-binding protein [Kribbibacterium absianum]|nr:ABC transporter ATP-binding protein [Olsenella sp. YH-ols2216]